MTTFLVFYIFIYGTTNIYFLRKLTRAFPISTRLKSALYGLVLLLFAAPLISRTLEKNSESVLAGPLASGGYLWMGLLFFFVTSAFALDLASLTFRHVGTLREKIKISARTIFLVSLTYTICAGFYSYFEAKNIITEKIEIRSSRIPKSTGRIRIVQISDLHIGQVVKKERTADVIRSIELAAPDLIVSTGDLVDGHQRHFKGLEPLLAQLKPRLGKYAIMGNHEYYVGIDEAIAFTEKAGFKVLKNSSTAVDGHLQIIGIDDVRQKADRPANDLIETELLAPTAGGEFRLLLKHKPLIAKGAPGKFDLQLSGHVHKGQLFPFNFLTWLSFPVRAGMNRLESGSLLYVSRGTGVWGPPLRFLAPPEITVIDLLPEQ